MIPMLRAMLLPMLLPGALALADDRFVPVVPISPQPGSVLNVAPTAAAASVKHIDLKLDRRSLPADGQSAVTAEVTLRDADGAPVSMPVILTIEVSGDSARVQLPSAATDELGSRQRDTDRLTPGTQVLVENGKLVFNLLAPTHPQDVTLRVSAGAAVASIVVSCETEARQMIAAGLIEGVLHVAGHNPITVRPAGMSDGFEYQLSNWSRAFNDGRTDVAVRSALFLKGTIQGNALLTAAFDSDKYTPARLLADVQPDQFYPVYGDSSIQGFDAKSTSRLYVRIDKKRSFLLYGDFVTGNGFATQGQAQGGTVPDSRLNLLGAYNRTLTGAEGHYETGKAVVNGFVTRDTLKQVVEEYRANGTSGPFTIHNTSALENSEKVEIIVRDKNQLDLIVSDTTLEPYVDYSFEPFSGAILFNAPVPSLDPAGNPESIRVTYEVDQGGSSFWLLGADGEYNLNSYLTVGGSFVDDRNPTSPFRMESVNAMAKLGEHTTLTVEAAQTSATLYQVNGQTFTNPTGQTGEIMNDASGRAERLQLAHTGDELKANAWAIVADPDFENPSSGVTPGERQYGERSSYVIDPLWTLRSEAIRTEDTVADASQTGGLVDVDYAWSKALKLSAGVRYAAERGLVGSQSFIGANPSPGSLFAPASGFGSGINAAELNPLTGQPATQNLSPLTPGTPGTPGDALDGTFLFAGATWHPQPRLTLDGRLEESVEGDGAQRYEIGAAWQVAERTRLYVRDEQQTGLSSAYSLNGTEATHSLIAGVDTTYLQDTNRSAAAYSEYRLEDAVSGMQSQEATGLRDTWVLAPGLNLRTTAEYLDVQSATAPGAVAATAGLDYTASADWKASSRVEWRKLYDDPGVVGRDGQTSTLLTLSLARKLNRDWTLLTREYYLIQNNHEDAEGNAKANGWQNRYQLGVAYRPVDDNRFDALARYEYREEQNILGDAAGLSEQVASVLGNWHPSRPWWLSTRVAFQDEHDRFAAIEGGGRDSYQAWLAGGRLLYDLSERWDVGVQAYTLRGDTGSAEQYALGVEVGRLMVENLWLSLGYDFSGFTAKDMSGSDYTQQGVYLRIRWKFTQDLFKGSDREFNRALDR